MARLRTWLDTALSSATAVVIVVMMLHIVINAVSRHFFASPLYGTNEIAGHWYLPIIALTGIPVAWLRGEHIAVTLLHERMSPRAADWCMLLARLITAALSLGFAVFGFTRAVEQMELGATAGVTTIITWPVFFLVPCVFALLALICVLEALGTARAVLTEGPPAAPDPSAAPAEEARACPKQ